MNHTPCPHCHTKAKHGERVSCCSGCGVLFTSGSAFDKHRKDFKCLAPESVGLARRINKTDPDAIAWGLPASDHWARPEHDCSDCADCLHDGNKCCGCYDGACCKAGA